MADVARIEFSNAVIDNTKPSSITVSSDKLLTISLYLQGDILPEKRQLKDGEAYDYRDAHLAHNLSHVPITVKLLKINKDDPGSTLVIEADIDTKVPGTGDFELLNKESELVENEL